MAQTRSPREVFLALVNGVSEERFDELPDLYADQTYVIHPFDPHRAPALRTRDDLRKHFTGGTSAGPSMSRRATNIVIHETTDPEVIVAEFEYEWTVEETGEQSVVPGIFVMRVRDGEIVSSRDYFDHLTSARVRGMLPTLVESLSTSAPAER